MSDKQADGHSVALAVVALFAGILIGIVGAGVYSVDDEVASRSDAVVGASEAQMQYQITLSLQLQAHALYGADALQATVEDRGESESALEAYRANADNFAATVGVVYGESAEESLAAQLNQHIDALIEYTEAQQAGDGEAIAEAEVEIEQRTGELAELFEEVFELDSERVETVFTGYTERMQQTVLATAAGNFDEAYEERRQAAAEMRVFSEDLGAVIFDAHSDNF